MSYGPAHLLDFSRAAQDMLAFDHGGDLIQAEGIALNGEAALNGPDAVASAKEDLLGFGKTRFKAADLFADLSDKFEDFGRDGEGGCGHFLLKFSACSKISL